VSTSGSFERDDDVEIADHVGMALVRLSRLVSCMAAHTKNGMERSAFGLLATLVMKGPQRSSALAEAVHADPSTISRQVAQLVRDGFVERRNDPEDGRAMQLAATQTGTRVLAEHRARRNEAIAAMLTSWPAEERQQFARLLERFVDDFESHLPILITELARGARSGGEM
jgi:DNA-binding MarR family transcriptional regulator